MLRTLRHTRFPALLALLLILGSVPVSIAALLHGADDTACQPVLVQHDERAHRVGTPRTLPNVPQHCAVCHWLHSLQTIVASSSAAVHTTTVAHLSVQSLRVVALQTIGDLPARAPPRT